MNFHLLKSSNLHSAAYDYAKNELHIRFHRKDGLATYVYHDVPEGDHVGLINAAEAGKYFNETIKNRYKFTKL